MNHEAQDNLLPQRALSVLIVTAGAAGGALLADWLTGAAIACDFAVQCTPHDGDLPRGGAGSYYLEIYPVAAAQLRGRQPVMALAPAPGAVDVMLAFELLEAARALRQAYQNPECCTLLASTRRLYTEAEKIASGDGRFDSEALKAAVRQGSGHSLLLDLDRVAQLHGCQPDAVMFGALAAAGALPLARAFCEHAIREHGVAVAANLRGFAAGFALAGAPASGQAGAPVDAPEDVAPVVTKVRERFPVQTFAVLEAGAAHLRAYQDDAYAALYLQRLEGVLALDRSAGGADDDYSLTRETARQLALWMAYPDLIREADVKSGKRRMERVRAEAAAGPDEVLVLTDYLSAGPEEIGDILPPYPARLLGRWNERRKQKNGGRNPSPFTVALTSSSIAGFLVLRIVGSLRAWRRHSTRYRREQAAIERWLGAIKRIGFAVQDNALALEIAECARLVTGDHGTHGKGVAQFAEIFKSVIESGAHTDPEKLRTEIRRARLAALAYAEPVKSAQKKTGAEPGKAVFWMPRADLEKMRSEHI